MLDLAAGDRNVKDLRDEYAEGSVKQLKRLLDKRGIVYPETTKVRELSLILAKLHFQPTIYVRLSCPISFPRLLTVQNVGWLPRCDS